MSDLSDLASTGLLNPDTADQIPLSIRFEQLSHRYHADSEEALKGIDFSIRSGEVFGIIGRSGTGKSTLVRTVNLLKKPVTGRVLAGSSATRASHNLDRHWRNARGHTLHDLVRWKYHAIGNYLLNGVYSRRHYR